VGRAGPVFAVALSGSSLKRTRFTGGATPTSYQYTGQRNDSSIGLYPSATSGQAFYNARYYDPALGRFIQADTIVPSPANPQSYNRYAYVLNNPLRYTDPTGRCAAGDSECWALADQLYQQYGWSLAGLGSHGIWTVEQLRVLLEGALKIELWFARMGGGDARGRMRAALGGTRFSHAGIIGNLKLPFNLVEPGSHHVRGSTVHFQQRGFSVNDVVHEMAHVLDNRLGPNIPIGAALWGGGPADDMSRLMGVNPTSCLNRSNCPGYNPTDNNFPSDYAGYGPSEDFAESFRLSVLDPGALIKKSPQRETFMVHLGRSLTTDVGEFQGSPYASFQRYGGIPGFGSSTPLSMGSNNLFQ